MKIYRTVDGKLVRGVEVSQSRFLDVAHIFYNIKPENICSIKRTIESKLAFWRYNLAEKLIDVAKQMNSKYSFTNVSEGSKKELIYDIVCDGVVIGDFEVFTEPPYNSPYRYFIHHNLRPAGEWQGMDIDSFKEDFANYIWFDEKYRK